MALTHVIPAVRATPGARLVALASRSIARAHDLAAETGVERSYGAYRDLLADPEIDAVYIAVPNALHHEWAREALLHGKAVLVEKPAVLMADDALELSRLAASRDLLLAEAFMYRFQQQWTFVQDWVERHVLPDSPMLMRLQIGFRLDPRRPDIRWQPSLGGGSLFDLGCYAVNAATGLFGRPAQAWLLQADRRPSRVDDLCVGALVFPGGHLAVLGCDFRYDWVNSPVELRTPTATLELEHAFNPAGQPTQARILRQGHPPQIRHFPAENAYAAMLDEFCRWRPQGAQSAFARGEAERLVTSAHALSLLRTSAQTINADSSRPTTPGRNPVTSGDDQGER